MTIHLVTFSDASMSRSAELCVDSAMRHGCNIADMNSVWTLEQMTGFHKDWEHLRGVGYWHWKPVIILKAMEEREAGDIIIYSDAGVEFIDNVNYIIDRMDQDIFLFGNQYEHAHWCKRDIVDEIWPLRHVEIINLRDHDGSNQRWVDGCWARFSKQAQASVIFFRVSDYTRKFVKEWLDWCLFEGGRLIDDSPSRTPNHPEFRENRHDQAILTTMAYRDGLKLHWWPAQYNDGAFEYPRGDYPDEGYPILVHHHRKRNADWEAAA